MIDRDAIITLSANTSILHQIKRLKWHVITTASLYNMYDRNYRERIFLQYT